MTDSQAKIRILLVTGVADNGALEVLSRSQNGFFEISNCSCGLDGLNTLEESSDPIDVIVTSFELSDMSGLEFSALVTSREYDLPILFVVDCDGQQLCQILDAGARFYLVRDAQMDCWKAAVDILPCIIEQHAHDLSQRQERDLRVSSLLNALPDVIFELGLDGTVLHANEEAAALGWPLEELGKINIKDLLVEEDVPRAFENIKNLIHSDKKTQKNFYRVCNVEGATIPIQVNTILVEKEGEPARIYGVAKDITDQEKAQKEKSKLEEQLRQAQKMEAVGRLAGGIAHDFNNILTGITGYAELIMATLDETDPLFADIEEIKLAADRAARLTHQLLAFSRKQIVEPKVINVNTVIEASRNMLSRIIGENIELTFHPEPELWHIKIDPGQIEQVLVNLVVNARDAMPDVGALAVETFNEVLNASFAAGGGGHKPGPYVVLSVKDTGQGMDSDTIKHIFEPFFTTKSKDKGTGLGLSTVYGIVKQNRGFIDVKSAVGEGTTFKFYFPRVFEKSEKIAKPGKQQAHVGTETVLLVEDEAIVRMLARNILLRHGYKVIEAADGESAYELCLDSDQQIDLVLTDVIMPNMNGKELYDQLQQLRPKLKGIFMSGYTADAIAQHGVLEKGINFVQKPFSVRTLAKKVREVLDESD